MLNRYLIKKYKKEFDHYIINGDDSILMKIPNDTRGWNPVEGWNMPDYTLVVINDHLVEFRKALVEVKTVQYNFSVEPTNPDGYPEEWKDVDKDIGILSNAHTGQYRIKPEEPKFKIGDIVRVKCVDGVNTFVGKVTSIREDDLTLNKNSIAFISDCTLWFPVRDELCWFWRTGFRVPLLSSFHSCSTVDADAYWCNDTKFLYDYCEPFMDELPDTFKDLKQ